MKRFRSIKELLLLGSHLLDAHPDDDSPWTDCAHVEHDGLVWKLARTTRSADLARIARGYPTERHSLIGPEPWLHIDGRLLPMFAPSEMQGGRGQRRRSRASREDNEAPAGRPRARALGAVDEDLHGRSLFQRRTRAVVQAAFVHLSERGRPQSRRDLLWLAGRAFSLPQTDVLRALRDDPRFHVTTDLIAVRQKAPQPIDREAGNSAPERGLPPVPVSDLVYALSLADTDEVLFRFAASSTDVQIRCDHIRTGADLQIWVTAKVTDRDLFDRLATIDGAQSLGSDLRLPLRPAPPAPATLPTALVWSATTAAQADATVSRVQIAWASQSEGWRMECVSCSTSELERRVEGKRTIRRLRARSTSRFPVTSCDRCGLPLSDPTSVALGIGPECRKYYKEEILTAAMDRRPSPSVRLGSRAPKQWRQLVRTWLDSSRGG